MADNTKPMFFYPLVVPNTQVPGAVKCTFILFESSALRAVLNLGGHKLDLHSFRYVGSANSASTVNTIRPQTVLRNYG